jgi:hypothetical protein
VVTGWKRLERKSTRRRRAGTTGSGLAAEREIGVQRVEAVSVPAQARDRSHRQSPSCQKTVGLRPSAVCGRAAEPQNPRCRGRQNYEHGSTASLSKSATIDGV